MSTTEVDLADIDKIVAETGKTADAVIPILRKIHFRRAHRQSLPTQ